MNQDFIKYIIKNQSDIWLKENPLLLNSQEKQKFTTLVNQFFINSTNAFPALVLKIPKRRQAPAVFRNRSSISPVPVMKMT